MRRACYRLVPRGPDRPGRLPVARAPGRPGASAGSRPAAPCRGASTTSWRELLAQGRPRGQAAQADLGAGREGERRDPGLGTPRPAHAGRGHGDVGDPGAQALHPQPGEGQQPLGGRRRGPEPVGPLVGHVVHLLGGGGRGQPAVGLEAGVLGRHVGGRQVGVAGHVEGDRRRGRPGFAAGLGHRLGHQLDVEVVADGGDVARLVAAEQVARPADLEVSHGDLEPRAELGVLADRAQPLVGLLGEDPVGRVEEVGVGPLVGPADPTPQLVQLAQAEEVGPVDHQRVDRRHVDARLDDRRADQHVVAPLPEVDDDLLEAALVHLAVGHGYPGLGDQGPQPAGHGVDVGHPVVHVEDLPLAQQLSAERLGDGRLVGLAHVGEDGPSVGRRRVHHRKVADAGEGHLQGARDGAGREGEHVHPLGHALDRLFVGDPEPLLLVDHQQAEVLEAHVGGEQAVGAHHHVHRAVGQAVDHLLGLGGREEPAQQLDPYGEPGVAVGEGEEVLAGQQGGGHQHGRLLGVLDRLEDGPHRHLGLAEAHVPADQSVHRAGLLHVGLHLGHGPGWSAVSTWGKADSISCCQGVSGAKAWPSTASRWR